MSTTVIHAKQWFVNGERKLSSAEARRVLGIRSRHTFNRDRAALELHDRQSFSLSDIVDFLKLRLYLALAPGEHSREGFRKLRKQPALLNMKFRKAGIDLNAAIQQLYASVLAVA